MARDLTKARRHPNYLVGLRAAKRRVEDMPKYTDSRTNLGREDALEALTRLIYEAEKDIEEEPEQ